MADNKSGFTKGDPVTIDGKDYDTWLSESGLGNTGFVLPQSVKVELIGGDGKPLRGEPPAATISAGMPWNQPPGNPVEDIRALSESLKNQPYQPDQLLAKVVDWLPRKEPDGTWKHFEIRGANLLLSQLAYDELKNLPEGVDSYGMLKGMVDV
jgi:hypothetical protein